MESGTESENQLMVMPDREVGNYMYRRAVAYAREKNIYQSLQCYVDAFLLRSEESHCEDKNWLDFSGLSSSSICWGKTGVLFLVRRRHGPRLAEGRIPVSDG